MPRNRRVVIRVAIAALCLGSVAVVWGGYRFVAWVSDLPNRIHVEVDGDAVSQVSVYLCREALRSPDPAIQRETLAVLAAGCDGDPALSAYVRDEFAGAFEQLSASPDPAIAEQASALLSDR